MELTLSETRLVAGEKTRATVTVTNDGTQPVAYTRSDAGDDARVFDTSGDPVSATHSSDAIGNFQVTLGPGEHDTFRVTVRAYGCGDTSSDGKVPLEPGAYTVSAALNWAAHGDSGQWVTDAVAVKVVRGA